MPAAIRLCLALLLLAHTASAQVVATVPLDTHGLGQTITSAPAGGLYHVSAVVRTQHLDSAGTVIIDSTSIPGALVSPAAFDLHTGEQQALRVRVPLAGLPHGTILRLVVTFDPVASASSDGKTLAVSLNTRWIMRNKLVTP